MMLSALALLLTLAPDASLTDRAFLESALWNDGQAEVAFYRVDRDLDQYGRERRQSFLMGTYLVKQDFDRARQTKARAGALDPVSAFKWAAFYEFESDNSYQYKLNYVVNAAQADLAPLKASFTSFDWCSNQYREMAFGRDARVDYLMRSDDYGNAAESFPAPGRSYPVALLPLLVRALDFRGSDTAHFDLLLEDGTTVAVEARLEGTERVDTEAGAFEAERVRLAYGADHPSLLSRRGDREETYWRGVGADRLLLKLDSATYRMTLVEQLRSPYWDENVFRRLRRVDTRP